METYCWYVLLNKVFVDEICLEVVWASSKNLCKLIGSPYTSFLLNRESVKYKFVHGESRKTISRTKKPKNCNHWKGNIANSFLSKKKTVRIDFIQKYSCKKNYWKKQRSQFNLLRNPRKQVIRNGNSMRKKMLFGILLKSVSLLKIPKKFFIQEKSTKENFVHRKTTETDFSEGKVKKINSNSENSEKIF